MLAMHRYKGTKSNISIQYIHTIHTLPSQTALYCTPCSYLLLNRITSHTIALKHALRYVQSNNHIGLIICSTVNRISIARPNIQQLRIKPSTQHFPFDSFAAYTQFDVPDKFWRSLGALAFTEKFIENGSIENTFESTKPLRRRNRNRRRQHIT